MTPPRSSSPVLSSISTRAVPVAPLVKPTLAVARSVTLARVSAWSFESPAQRPRISGVGVAFVMDSVSTRGAVALNSGSLFAVDED